MTEPVDAPFPLQQFQHGLTRFAGWWAGRPRGSLTTRTIADFVRRYDVDMQEAAEPDIARYRSFNDFFTRALRPDARPLGSAGLVSPVDGAISQLGPLGATAGGGHQSLVQAKGHAYTAAALVGGDAPLAARLDGGHFATLYLSPRDYHRVHMPAAGVLRRMVYVPGALYSVNPSTAARVPGLFARNERVVCEFQTPRDASAARDGLPPGTPWVLVLVGATIVGSMATTWHGLVSPPRGTVRRWDYPDGQVRLERGQEMGRFLLGSTVVLLFPRGPLRFAARWQPGASIRMGESMADWGEGAPAAG